jgi:hypothetical protein
MMTFVFRGEICLKSSTNVNMLLIKPPLMAKPLLKKEHSKYPIIDIVEMTDLYFCAINMFVSYILSFCNTSIPVQHEAVKDV